MTADKQTTLAALHQEYHNVIEAVADLENVPLNDEIPQEYWQERDRLNARALELTIEIGNLERGL